MSAEVENAVRQATKASADEIMNTRNELYPKVKKLIENIKMFAWCLQENLIDTYVKYTTTKSLEQLNYKNRKQKIIKEYESLIKEVELLRMKTNSSDDKFQEDIHKLVSSFDNLKDLFTAVEAGDGLAKALNEFSRYQYAESLQTTMAVLNKLRAIKFEGNSKKALANLVYQAETQYSGYVAEVCVEWEQLFKWCEIDGVNSITYVLEIQESSIILKNVLKSLYVSNKFNVELAQFSKFFIDKMLHNIIRHNCEIFADDVDNDDTIVFNIKINLKEESKPSFQTVFNNIVIVFEFLNTTLGVKVDEHNDFIPTFAKSIRNKFFEKIYDDCIRNNLPSCDSSYEQYKALVVELDTFNKFLIDIKFVEQNNSLLNKYINDTESVLYNKKCDKLLSDVRELLSQSLSYGTLTVGEDNYNNQVIDETKSEPWDFNHPLLLPKCVISENVKKILNLIVDHLQESTKLPEKYSKQLVLYIRSASVLYQSIVPLKFKINLECCPLDIALFFNNCFYLAHGFLGPPWKLILPPALASHVTTVLLECIMDLRLLGLEKMSLYLQSQKNKIIKNILPEEPTPWTQNSFESFNSGINSALSLLRDLKSSWYNILPSRMYQLAMCTLVQAVLQANLERVFADIRPIEEKLVYLMAIRFKDLVEEIKQLFEEPINLEKKVENWRKFIKLPQLLRAQLLEITELWTDDSEVHSSYSCDEIRQMIKMRFPDDKYRLKTLVEIQ